MVSVDVNESLIFPYHFVDFKIHHLVVEKLNSYLSHDGSIKMGSYSIKDTLLNRYYFHVF